MEPIFSGEELKLNENRKETLFKLVASGGAILFVGAGSSAVVGHPTWPELLIELEKLANHLGGDFKIDQDQRENNPLQYVEGIKKYIHEKTGNLDRYFAKLHDLYAPRDEPCADLHKELTQMPFKGFLTTNYDKVLEAALAVCEPHNAYKNSVVFTLNAARSIGEFLYALDLENNSRRIAHIHGIYDVNKSIILSKNDYNMIYGDFSYEKKESGWTFHKILIWSLLATRRIVFIGFSMTDPYLQMMLDIVSNHLWNFGKSIHFAIMGISKENATESFSRTCYLKDKYGVEVVFYEENDRLPAHGLESIVTEMYRFFQIDKGIPEKIKEDEKEIVSIAEEGAIGSTSFVKKDMEPFLEWINKVNAKLGTTTRRNED